MICFYYMYRDTYFQKRLTLNLPYRLLREAQKVTGKNMTETIVSGLEILKRLRGYDLAMKLRAKRFKLDIDLKTSRERHR